MKVKDHFFFIETENVVEDVSINGHFVPPLPKGSAQVPSVPPQIELSQTVIDDSDSQSRELPSFDFAVCLQSIAVFLNISKIKRVKMAFFFRMILLRLQIRHPYLN